MKILYLAYSIPKPNLPQSMFIYNRIKELVNQKVDIVPVTASNLYSNYLSKKNLFLILKYWGRDYNLINMGLDLDLKVINLKKIELPHYYFNLLFYNNISRIKNIYFSNKCNLIHAHFVKEGMYAYWLKKKFNIPYVLTAHAYDITIVPHRSKRLHSITLKVLENSEKTIFVSNDILDKARELGYSANNSVIIRNGYELKNFHFIPTIAKKKDLKIIGFVGRLTKVKRADYLPEILKNVRERFGNVKLYIVGEGSQKSKIYSKLKKYKVQLYQVKTNKEYDAITLEIETSEQAVEEKGFKSLELEEAIAALEEDIKAIIQNFSLQGIL